MSKEKILVTGAAGHLVPNVRQAIADSWPRSLDDSDARQEWGWEPDWDLETMVDDMLTNLKRKPTAKR